MVAEAFTPADCRVSTDELPTLRMRSYWAKRAQEDSCAMAFEVVSEGFSTGGDRAFERLSNEL
jgi:hypothetical protein